MLSVLSLFFDPQNYDHAVFITIIVIYQRLRFGTGFGGTVWGDLVTYCRTPSLGRSDYQSQEAKAKG